MQKIKYIEGDLFKGDLTNSVIAHVCNDKGAFGSGFVVPLANRFPLAKERYFNWYRQGHEEYSESFVLGNTQFVIVDDRVVVAQMIAQTLGGHRPLYYNHLSKCMDAVAEYAIETDARIVAPLFGAGLACGNWNIIESLIEDSWSRRGIETNIYFLPQFLPQGFIPPGQNDET